VARRVFKGGPFDVCAEYGILIQEADGDRCREVVQPDQRLWIHSAASGGKDVFVHISAVERAGLSTLNEGQQVQYEEVANNGKTSAENLKVK
jgi:cold shock CspA family protein